MNKLGKENRERLNAKIMPLFGFVAAITFFGCSASLILLFIAPKWLMLPAAWGTFLSAWAFVYGLHFYLYAKLNWYTRIIEFIKYPCTWYWYISYLKRCSIDRLKYNRRAFGVMLENPRPGHEWVIKRLRSVTDKAINKRIIAAKKIARKNYEKDIKKRKATRI